VNELVDLPKLLEGTQARLRTATSEQEARAAFQRFVDVFGDGPPSSICARLGYRRPAAPGIDF